MKINWKVRFQNRVWLLTFIAALVGLIYQICGVIGIVPGISQDVALGIIAAVVDLLVMLGVVIDPTTPEIRDSERALGYVEPGIPGEDHDDDK